MDRLREIFDEATHGNVDLEDLLHHLGRALHYYAWMLTGSESLAEDALHDLMVSLLEQGSELKKVDNPRGWMFTVIRRLALKGKRRAHRERTINITPTVDLDPADRAIFNEAWEMFTDKEKEIAVLHVWEGLTFAEIAEVLGISRNTALSCFHRAIKRLRTRNDLRKAVTPRKGHLNA